MRKTLLLAIILSVMNILVSSKSAGINTTISNNYKINIDYVKTNNELSDLYSEYKMLGLNDSSLNINTLNYTDLMVLEKYPSMMPLKKSKCVKITSKFGIRRHPIYKRMLKHNGIDIYAPKSSQIYSTMDGIVTEASYLKNGYGNCVIIENSFGIKTMYAHLNKITIKRGQNVKRGDIVGIIGNTGLTTGIHLHYEVIIYNINKNPENYLSEIANI